MSSAEPRFLETKEYRRFQEFCYACRCYRYIGLCYGPPGVGKTLSARHYSNWNQMAAYRPYQQVEQVLLAELLRCDAIFYTPQVVNSPGQIDREVAALRNTLRELHLRQVQEEEETRIESARQKLEDLRKASRDKTLWYLQQTTTYQLAEEVFLEARNRYSTRCRAVRDPTALILIDETDRLKMAGLEQLREIFDRGGIGLVLIGMPGLEKRLARYPQLYSRVGFVHEFRPLTDQEVRSLLLQHCSPPSPALPPDWLTDEAALAAIFRVTGGNFRLLHRLVTQIGRILEINQLQRVTQQVVEAARETLVIGTA